MMIIQHHDNTIMAITDCQFLSCVCIYARPCLSQVGKDHRCVSVCTFTHLKFKMVIHSLRSALKQGHSMAVFGICLHCFHPNYNFLKYHTIQTIHYQHNHFLKYYTAWHYFKAYIKGNYTCMSNRGPAACT